MEPTVPYEFIEYVNRLRDDWRKKIEADARIAEMNSSQQVFNEESELLRTMDSARVERAILRHYAHGRYTKFLFGSRVDGRAATEEVKADLLSLTSIVEYPFAEALWNAMSTRLRQWYGDLLCGEKKAA